MEAERGSEEECALGLSGAKRAKGLYSYLLAFVLACLLPVIIASGLAAWQAGVAYRDTAAARLQDTSLTLAQAIEADLTGHFTLLRALAVNLPAPGGPSVVDLPRLTDFEGTLALVEEDRAGSAMRPQGAQETAMAAIASGQPIVSNLVPGTDVGQHRLALALPVARGGGPRAALVMTASPQVLIKTLQQRGDALRGILVAVTDGNGRIIARSRDPESFIGIKAPDWARLLALGAESGTFEAMTAENTPIMMSFNSLHGTPGWALVVGEPLDVFNARWQNPVVGVLLGGGVALVLSILAALGIGRMILRPVEALGRHSEAIAEGVAPDALPSIPHSAIREFEALRRRMAAADRIRREEERRYRTISEAGALVLWRRTSEGDLVFAAGWETLTGCTQKEGLGTAWLDRVHPEDRARVVATFRDIVADRRTVDLEFRLKVSDGSWLWVRDRGGAVLGDDGAVIEWVGVLEDIDARKRSEAMVAHMARHDALTGLANRIQLRERLEQALAGLGRGSEAALLCLDLDLFKSVNDRLGHPAGDALLCMVADRLRGLVRGTDLIARVGGDEFSIVQGAGGQPEAAATLAARIVAALSKPFDIGGQEAVIGVSVGIALIRDPGLDLDTCLKRADTALYRAKQAGRGRACFFEEQLLVDQLGALAKAHTRRKPSGRKAS